MVSTTQRELSDRCGVPVRKHPKQAVWLGMKKSHEDYS